METFNKEMVAKNLRASMARCLMSVEDLAKSTNLSKHQIDNILYCRALRLDNLKKIATCLNIKVEELLADNETRRNTRSFNTKIYSKIIASIDVILTFYNLQATQHSIEKISNLVYKNYKDIENLDEAVRGMVLLLRENSADITSTENEVS